MDTLKHFYPITILETYLDTFGHMNHAVYLQLFEEARWDMITAHGYGMHRIQETGLGPTILAVDLKFRKELRLRQKIIIETQVTSFRKKLAIISHNMKDDTDRLYCSAEFVFGLFDIRARKLVSPTPEWLKAIGVKPTSTP